MTDSDSSKIVPPGGPEEPIRCCWPDVVNQQLFSGGLRPAIGVHNIQIMRANREQPELADGFGWTYNHQPYLIYWNQRFWVEYLSSPFGEHEDSAQTMLVSSTDGYTWSTPVVLFPPYQFEDGNFSIHHQRNGFYLADNQRLLALAFYGPACPYPWPDQWDMPNDGRGMGRVAREIKANGSLGEIYFVRYNTHAGWGPENTPYPYYTSAPDADFRDACEQLLSNPLATLSWWEEDRSSDGFYPVEGQKAFAYYRRKDGQVVGLWKNAQAALSADEGKTWSPVVRLPTLPVAGAKTWGQATQDGRFALVFNPSRDNGQRWPLAVALSEDGVIFDRLFGVYEQVPPMRYPGFCKDLGPQYVRGIEEHNSSAPDDAIWLTYSVNKEDIWVSRVPVPIRWQWHGEVNDQFNAISPGGLPEHWTITSGRWTQVMVERDQAEAKNVLALSDCDPYDYASALRVFEKSAQAQIKFGVNVRQARAGWFEMTIEDEAEVCALQLIIDSSNWLWYAEANHMRRIGCIPALQWVNFTLEINLEQNHCTLAFAHQPQVFELRLKAPVRHVERIRFQTGPKHAFPSKRRGMFMETPDLPNAGYPTLPAAYWIDSLNVRYHTGESHVTESTTSR